MRKVHSNPRNLGGPKNPSKRQKGRYLCGEKRRTDFDRERIAFHSNPMNWSERKLLKKALEDLKQAVFDGDATWSDYQTAVSQL